MNSLKQAMGTVIISYDDGDVNDFLLAYPVHKKYNVPAEVCIPSGYVGTEGRLTQNQLLELQDSGWEIVSHTKNHISLADELVQRNVAIGDEKLYVSDSMKFKPCTQLTITQNGKSDDITVLERGADSGGNYILIDRKVNNNYMGAGKSRIYRVVRRMFGRSNTSAVIGVSDAQAVIEIETSKQGLEAIGFRV